MSAGISYRTRLASTRVLEGERRGFEGELRPRRDKAFVTCGPVSRLPRDSVLEPRLTAGPVSTFSAAQFATGNVSKQCLSIH